MTALEEFDKKVGDLRYLLPVPPKSVQECIDALILKKQNTLYKNKRTQCSKERHRSLIDICRTVKSYFDVSTEEIIKLVARGLVNKKYISSFCGTVNRQVFYSRPPNFDIYYHGYTDGMFNVHYNKTSQLHGTVLRDAIAAVKSTKSQTK